jgi:hypothetical protein
VYSAGQTFCLKNGVNIERCINNASTFFAKWRRRHSAGPGAGNAGRSGRLAAHNRRRASVECSGAASPFAHRSEDGAFRLFGGYMSTTAPRTDDEKNLRLIETARQAPA